MALQDHHVLKGPWCVGTITDALKNLYYLIFDQKSLVIVLVQQFASSILAAPLDSPESYQTKQKMAHVKSVFNQLT